MQGVNNYYSPQTERRRHNYSGSLERLWAYLTVRQLLDKHLASTDKGNDLVDLFAEKQAHHEDSSPKARALSLALKVGLLTRHLVMFLVADKNEIS
jgi:hypothetical protein